MTKKFRSQPFHYRKFRPKEKQRILMLIVGDGFKDGFKGLSGQKLVFNNITCDRNDGLELFRQSQTCKRDLCQHLTSCIPHVSKSKLFETV